MARWSWSFFDYIKLLEKKSYIYKDRGKWNTVLGMFSTKWQFMAKSIKNLSRIWWIICDHLLASSNLQTTFHTRTARLLRVNLQSNLNHIYSWKCGFPRNINSLAIVTWKYDLVGFAEAVFFAKTFHGWNSLLTKFYIGGISWLWFPTQRY